MRRFWQSYRRESCSTRSRRAATIALNRFIYALGIRHVGETNARRLARHFERFESLREAAREAQTGSEAREKLINIEGIGEVVAEAVADFFMEPHNETALDALLDQVRTTPMEAVEQRQPGRRQDDGVHGRA